PCRFGERLRRDVPAFAGLTFVVVQRILKVSLGVGEEDIAAALQIFLLAGDLIDDAEIDELARVSPVNSRDGVAVKIERGLFRISVKRVRPDGADVLPLPWPDFLAELQAGAVLGACVIM